MTIDANEALTGALAKQASDVIFKLDAALGTFSLQLRVHGDLQDVFHGAAAEGLAFCEFLGLPSDILDLCGTQQFNLGVANLPSGFAGVKVATQPLVSGKGIHGVMRLLLDAAQVVDVASLGNKDNDPNQSRN